MVMHFQPLGPQLQERTDRDAGPQLQSQGREAEAWSVRQFAQIQRVFEEMMLVLYSTYVESLAAPLVIQESFFIEVIELEAFVPGGTYELTVSWVAAFQQITDRMIARVMLGGAPLSPEFFVQALAANEVQPFTYSTPILLKEAVAIALEVRVEGPGTANIIIPDAHIFIKRLL